jgi:CheY-like chemotaxis protein
MQPMPPTRPSQRILVVDDDDAVRAAIRFALEHHGYEILEARGGADAIGHARVRAPHLILCDIFMPGKDGFDTIRELRREFPQVPVVAMSGGGAVGGTSALRMARHLGAVEVLHKPLHNEGLLGVIRQFAKSA